MFCPKYSLLHFWTLSSLLALPKIEDFQVDILILLQMLRWIDVREISNILSTKEYCNIFVALNRSALFKDWHRLVLLAPTGALVLMMVYYISRPLFQIFTQSLDAIDVTSVTLRHLNKYGELLMMMARCENHTWSRKVKVNSLCVDVVFLV